MKTKDKRIENRFERNGQIQNGQIQVTEKTVMCLFNEGEKIELISFTRIVEDHEKGICQPAGNFCESRQLYFDRD